MSLDSKVIVYHNMIRESDKLLTSLSEVNWYGDPKEIDTLLENNGVDSTVSYLSVIFGELKRQGETIKTAEWNEKLIDALRVFKRFLWKNRKDDSIAKECIDNLEHITVLEM